MRGNKQARPTKESAGRDEARFYQEFERRDRDAGGDQITGKEESCRLGQSHWASAVTVFLGGIEVLYIQRVAAGHDEGVGIRDDRA